MITLHQFIIGVETIIGETKMIVEVGPNNCSKCRYKAEPKYTEAKVRCKNKTPETKFLYDDEEGWNHWVCFSYEEK